MNTGWWVHEWWQYVGPIAVVSWIFWVLFSISLHELAHGWAALWQGDPTPRIYNRMTMNPVVHMGPWSLLMFALIGIAWGVMPVNPSNYRWGRQGRFFVAGAGPAMNVVLAIIAMTCGAIWARYAPANGAVYDNVSLFFLLGGMLNIVLALFNMLPVPPLDGADVLSGLSHRAYEFFQSPNAQMVGMLIVLAIFLTGVGGAVFSVARTISDGYMQLLAGVLP